MRLDLITLSVPQFSYQFYESGATYRGPDSIPDNSCQYIEAKYMDSLTSPHIVGVGKWWWQESKSCGQCLLIRSDHAQAVGVIGDFCPGCSPRQLDLNPTLSAKLSSKHKPQNYQKLYVARIPCVTGRPPQLHIHRDSSPWVLYLIPIFMVEPVQSLCVDMICGYHDKYGRWVVEMHDLKYRSAYIAQVSNSLGTFQIKLDQIIYPFNQSIYDIGFGEVEFGY